MIFHYKISVPLFTCKNKLCPNQLWRCSDEPGTRATAGAVSQPCRQIHEIFGYNLSIWLCSWLGTFKPLIDYSSADLRLTLWWIMHTVGPISLMEITLQTMIIVPRALKVLGGQGIMLVHAAEPKKLRLILKKWSFSLLSEIVQVNNKSFLMLLKK